jgi:hypothetical protein
LIVESLNKFQDKVGHSIDQSVDAFEIYILNNVLKLPQNISIKVSFINKLLKKQEQEIQEGIYNDEEDLKRFIELKKEISMVFY